MQVDGAIVEEQGIKFSIIVVKSHVLQSESSRDSFRMAAQSVFPSPIILMAQNLNGVPTYQGRKDIVDFLSKIDPSRIPWKRYTVN